MSNRTWWESLLSVSERRYLKKVTSKAVRVADFEPEYEKLSDADLAGKTAEFRQRLDNGEALDAIVPEAFAAVREASRRTLGMRHFDVQMIGGWVLHNGNIAEMLTGEGKTLVATLPLYVNALPGNNVHLVTTNDYLAKRDCEWMSPIYNALGMTAGSLQNMQSRADKKVAYGCDITYGTNSEFGFDYLRDNMAYDISEVMQRGHSFAIVDEVDSILIDEARTPLIISGQPEESSDTYYRFARIARKMEEGVHFEKDEKMRTAYPTEEGVALAERELKIDNLYHAEHNQLINHLNQAIRAQALYHRDKEYIVADGEVKIVDEHTGRVMEGRRWSEGLHQAVEAKEGVRIREENQTVASITIQNYFRLYDKLAGMTGTAYTEAPEFKTIYDLDVIPIPPNRPVQRDDRNDLLFLSEQAKFHAIVRDVKDRHDKGQPVLIGTIAVEKSEALSNELARNGIDHQVLNAKQHEREALVIAEAGHKGAVTIATNMAGRGVDIQIDDEVRELGGLYVLGTERHESRRIDNQLRGRSGRQGDPGESRFYISVDDDLARVFGGDRLKRMLTGRLAQWPEDEPIEQRMLTRQIEKAQKKVEEVNSLRRKNVLKYDDVLNTQRNVIYDQRREVIAGRSIRDDVLAWLAAEVERIVNVHAPSDFPEEWDIDGMRSMLAQLFPHEWNPGEDEIRALERTELAEEMTEQAIAHYEAREKRFGEELMRQAERVLFLQTLDTRWREHLDNMDYLRDGIGLRGLAQKQPLAEYQSEGFAMFRELEDAVKAETVHLLMNVELEPTESAPPADQDGDEVIGHGRMPGEYRPDSDDDADTPAGNGAAPGTATGGLAMPGGSWNRQESLSYSAGSGQTALQELVEEGEEPAQPNIQQRVVGEKVGRNEPCPCGSGKKFKNCHGA